jgi:hypothetical protein
MGNYLDGPQEHKSSPLGLRYSPGGVRVALAAGFVHGPVGAGRHCVSAAAIFNRRGMGGISMFPVLPSVGVEVGF